jgi:hypothetical protein
VVISAWETFVRCTGHLSAISRTRKKHVRSSIGRQRHIRRGRRSMTRK